MSPSPLCPSPVGLDQAWAEINGTEVNAQDDGVKTNLIVICIFCSLFTMTSMLYIVYILWKEIKNAKTNAQKRKEKLWKLSVWLTMSIGLLAFIILFFSFDFSIKFYSIGDAIMDVIIIGAIIINFMQWRENVNYFLYKRYIQPLIITYYKEKHIFSTRIEALANNVIKNCGDSDSAVQLVKEGRTIGGKVFDDLEKISTQEEHNFMKSLFRYVLYKVGEVPMGIFCTDCCKKSFKGKGVNEALRFATRLYYSTLALMCIQIVVSLIETITDAHYFIPYESLTASQVKGHLASIGIPLSAFSALVSLVVIYLLVMSERLMKKVTDKADPFSNTNLLAMTLAFIDLQRILFKIGIYVVVSKKDALDPTTEVQDLMLDITRMRFAIMSVEMLFICIPIKHNFQPHRLEM